LLDYFLQQGDGVLWCEIAQWCEYPGADIRNLVWFLDHVMEEMHLGWTRRGLTSELDLDTLFLDLTRAALWLIHCDDPIDFLYTEHVHDSRHRTVNVLGRNWNEGGESADASFNFRAVIREPVQQETCEVIDSIVSPEMSLSRDTVDHLMENMLYCAACAMTSRVQSTLCTMTSTTSTSGHLLSMPWVVSCCSMNRKPSTSPLLAFTL